MTAGPALACSGLSAGYERVVVARDVDLTVDRGQILAVLGPNGAGKTTLLLTIAGFLQPMGGSISLDGRPVKAGSPRRMNAAGVVLVPDSRALFTRLTAVQNLELAARRGGASVDEVLDLFPALRRRARIPTGMLSGGEQQMLAVARALVQGPRVLLIDEMSMGLAPTIVRSLMPMIRRVADETRAAVVLVEQHVHLALRIADTAMVLVHGEVGVSGSASRLRADPEALEAAYLGTHVGVDRARTGTPEQPTV
ncbi:MAG: ABC transporter ATP-binding protein [Acidimicrobiia bacterium]|nr:ABC transporter ATP-binding protein [Acidimicrobiia bacterium]